jgi:hypothetical protein
MISKVQSPTLVFENSSKTPVVDPATPAPQIHTPIPIENKQS